MNTHKEEPKFKVGDRVKVSKGLNKEQAGTIEKLYYEGNIFKVRMEAGGWEFFRRGYLELAPLEPKEKCPHKNVEVKVRSADEGNTRVCESTCLSCGIIVGVDKVYLDDGELEAPEPPEIELHTPQSLEEEIDKWASEPTPPSQIEEEPMSEKEFQLMVSANAREQHEAWMENNKRQGELIDLTYKNELLRSDVYKLKLEAINKLTKD